MALMLAGGSIIGWSLGSVIARKSIDGDDDVTPAGGGFTLITGGGLASTSTTLQALVL
jgi:hypothetical protein